MAGPAQAYARLMAVVRRAHKGDLPLKDQTDRVRKLVTSGSVEDLSEVKPEISKPEPDAGAAQVT